ncbi:MAG: hypothetical protein ABMA13_10530 [Chthoniobacteraceae bacterium]
MKAFSINRITASETTRPGAAPAFRRFSFRFRLSFTLRSLALSLNFREAPCAARPERDDEVFTLAVTPPAAHCYKIAEDFSRPASPACQAAKFRRSAGSLSRRRTRSSQNDRLRTPTRHPPFAKMSRHQYFLPSKAKPAVLRSGPK